MRGNGGTWNRAGRRSGGVRPFDLSESPDVQCTCGTATAFGLMPQFVVMGIEVRCCAGCNGVLLAKRNGRWLTVAESLAGASRPKGDGE